MVVISRNQQKFSSDYSLSEKEVCKLHAILFENGDNGYAAYIIQLMKDLGGDVGKTLRSLNAGVNGKVRIIPVPCYNFFVKSIKEAIILTNYKYYVAEDGSISTLNMSRSERFKLAHIDKSTIDRTFKKYNVTYNKKGS